MSATIAYISVRHRLYYGPDESPIVYEWWTVPCLVLFVMLVVSLIMWMVGNKK